MMKMVWLVWSCAIRKLAIGHRRPLADRACIALPLKQVQPVWMDLDRLLQKASNQRAPNMHQSNIAPMDGQEGTVLMSKLLSDSLPRGCNPKMSLTRDAERPFRCLDGLDRYRC